MSDPARFDQARDAFLQGVQHHQAGRLPEAEASYERARALLPGRPSTLLNLAQVRLALGRPQAVPDDLAPLLAAEPGHPEALALLARALAALGHHDAALAAVDRLLAQRPQDAELHFRRGQLLGRLARPEAALAAFDAALAQDPAHAAAWTQRGSLLREAGRLDDAAQCFRQALAFGGDLELNRWFLAAVEGAPAAGPSAVQAPPRYVQALFDDYAEGFEGHLVERLGYRVPEALAAMLPARVFASALDLGCGTGLCARALQGRAQAIDGVDLSSRMVAAARGSGRYRRVDEAELVPWLQRCTDHYELVVAADVFIYIGDLAPVFAGVRRVLRPGGCFAFSVEAADSGVRLGAQLRYRHGEDLLRALAASHGLEVRAVQRTVLRQEQQRPIDGLLLVLG